jgi:ABC-type dipeptide/oligopeptide/nickel transport system permease component
MSRFIIRRLLQIPVAVLGITLIIFVLIRFRGDPTAIYLPPDAPPELREQLRHNLGLDLPLPVQYLRFVVNMLQGDFGESMWHRQPALDVVLSYIPATVQLMALALVLGALLGIVLGLLSATKKGSPLDTFLVSFSVFGQSMPSYWLGIMLILVFAVNLRWLPASGRGGWEHLVLPTFTLLMYLVPPTLLLVRSSVLELLREDFVLVARSKGLAERAILYGHVLKNALRPTITSLGMQMGRVMGGAVITETVFAWPGLGRLSVQAVGNRDMALVQASVVILAVWVILCNLAADVANASIDPRIQTD